MKQKTFFIVFEGLSYHRVKNKKLIKKKQTQALKNCFNYRVHDTRFNVGGPKIA